MREAGFEFDWEGVRARLARAEAAFSGAVGQNPEFLRRLFARRAEEFSRRSSEGEVSGGGPGALVVTVGKERFGFEMRDLRGVWEAAPVSSVPGSPPGMLGVWLREGALESVFDLGIVLGLGSPSAESARIDVGLRGGGGRMGVVVTRTLGVVPLGRHPARAPTMDEASLGIPFLREWSPEGVPILDADAIVRELEGRLSGPGAVRPTRPKEVR